MCLALSPGERSWYVVVGQWRSDGIQSPMGTQEKGILTPGVDSCIVKDQKCPIIAEFGKRNLGKLPMEDYLWEPALSLWTSPFNYLYDYWKQFTIVIAIPSLSGQLPTMCEFTICWILMVFQPGQINVVFSLGTKIFGRTDISRIA